MADTFTAFYPAVTFAASKNMGAVLNSHATQLLKIYRIGVINSQTAAVTGVVCQLEVQLYTAGTPGLTAPTTVTPVPHDSTNTAPTSATFGYAGTIAGTAQRLRRVFWSSDEAAISTGTLDELQTLVPLNILFDSGYGDANVQPLTLRGQVSSNDQMAMVFNATGAAGLLDTWIEFTRS